MTPQLSFFAEQASPEKQDVLRADVNRLKARIMELSEEIEDLQQQLIPFRREKARLEQAIRITHDQPDGVLVHSWSKAKERKPFYEGLLQLSLDYGGRKKQLADALTMRRGYARDQAKIEKELDMLKRRKDRKRGKT